MDPPSAVLDLLGGTEFRRGLLLGGGAAALLIVPSRLRGYWGLTWTAAGVAALYWAGGPTIDVILSEASAAPWVPGALAAVALVAAKGITSAPPSVAAPGLAIAAGGVWAAVPDTEAISVLLGVTAALIWLWWPLQLSSPGRFGAFVTAAVLAAAAAAGSYTRPGALIGGLGALASPGVFAARARIPLLVARIAQIALVLIWSRIAGRMQSGAGWSLAVGGSLSALVVLVAVGLGSKGGDRFGRTGARPGKPSSSSGARQTPTDQHADGANSPRQA